MIWSPKVTNDLMRHVHAGLTGSEIALKLGCSRGAVMGKCHRLGIRPFLSRAPSRRPVVACRRPMIVPGPFCQFPTDCRALGFGLHCRRCNGAAQMRRLNADPAFAEAKAERMRKLQATGSAAAATTMMRLIGVPAGAEGAYRLARRHGFSRQAAVEIAQREVAAREQVRGPAWS